MALDDVVYKIISLFFSLLILANAIYVRRVVKTWLFPACMFSLFWFFMTFFPLAVLFAVPAQPLAIIFIFFCTVFFSLGAYPFNWKSAIKKNLMKKVIAEDYFNNKFLMTVFIIVQPLTLIFLVMSTLDQGFTIRDLIFDLYKSAGRYAELRYSDNVKQTIYSRFVFTLSYVGVSIGGLLFSSLQTKKGRMILLFVCFLPSVLIMVTQSAKGALFLSMAFFYGGILVNRIYNNRLELSGKGSYKVLFMSVLIIVPAIIVSFLARGLSDESVEYVLSRLFSYFVSYAFGHVYTFSDWFAWYIGGSSVLSYSGAEGSHGFYNFMAIFELFGSNIEVPQGVFDEYFTYKDYLQSNIYSMYRALIVDFGIIGTFLYMGISGFLIHLAYYVLLSRVRPAFSIAVFVFLVGYIYQTYIISLLNYRTTYLTFILFWGVLVLNNKICRRKFDCYPVHAG